MSNIGSQDLTEIAFESLQLLKASVDELVIDKPKSYKFDERFVMIVSEDLVSQTRENELEKFPYWYTTLEITVCGPDKKRCKQLCLEAFDLVIHAFHKLTLNGQGPIYGLARGEKSIGVATYGGIPIDGYCARRTLAIHNSMEP